MTKSDNTKIDAVQIMVWAVATKQTKKSMQFRAGTDQVSFKTVGQTPTATSRSGLMPPKWMIQPRALFYQQQS